MLKLRLFVIKITINLFGTDWVEQFKLWNSPISLFCQEIKGFINDAESLKKELKIEFSEEFSRGLGRCSKMKAKFELKEKVQPVFKKKSNVPFALLKQINVELDRLEKCFFNQKLTLAMGFTNGIYKEKV